MQITKCVIYTRVSTDMQAEKEFNSCEAQLEKIESFVKSQNKWEVAKIYSDPGFTGANIKRPALQELLEDLKQGTINNVLVYKIDRLTRSPRDFYQLIELFDKYNVSFISITERFDTSTPSGRLLRNIMLTFAQFERELISERTRDKMLQRAQKGMWNGGIVPFGYKKENKKIFPDKKESAIVKIIYETYLTSGSHSSVYKLLKAKNILTRSGKTFSKSQIFNILRNIVYTGKIKYANMIHQGVHSPIIPEEMFNQAQLVHKKKIIKSKVYKNFILAGLIKCNECGSHMSPCYTNKRNTGKLKRYYYYRCTVTNKREWNSCTVKMVNANRLEDYILQNLERISLDKHYLDSLIFALNFKASGHRAGVEPSESHLKYNPSTLQLILKTFLRELSSRKGMERNLLIRQFVKDIKYSPEEIRLNLFYTPLNSGKDLSLPEKKEHFSDDGQGRQPVLPALKTGCLPENFVPSWGAGDRRNVAGICEPADKASSASCEGQAGRAYKNEFEAFKVAGHYPPRYNLLQ